MNVDERFGGEGRETDENRPPLRQLSRQRMPGRPGSSDASASPGLIAPRTSGSVAWVYPSSLLNRRPTIASTASGAGQLQICLDNPNRDRRIAL